MKKDKVSNVDSLRVDAIVFLFTGWLVRQNVYSAFKANCRCLKSDSETFRNYLRAQIRIVLRAPNLDLGDLLFVCFLFTSTPEGHHYWSRLSLAWRAFAISFRKNL